MKYIDQKGHCWEILDVQPDGSLKVRLEFANDPQRTAVYRMSEAAFEQLASQGRFRLLGRMSPPSRRASREAEETLA